MSSKRKEKRERYRAIEVAMWGHHRFRYLSRPEPCGQFLWVYLLTNPDTGMIPGVFRAGEATLAESLGWELGPPVSEAFREGLREAFREGLRPASPKTFREALAELEVQGLVTVDSDARVVWIPGAVEHNPPGNPNIVKSWARDWREIPDCPLKAQAWEFLRDYIYKAFGKGFQEAFAKACPKPFSKPSVNPSGNGSRNKREERREKREEISVSPLPLSEGGMRESESAPDSQAESKPPPKRRPPDATNIRALMDAWNEHAHPAMPRAQAEPKLSGPMRKELRERPLDGETGWLALIERMNASSWCRGEAPTSTRAMDISFLLRHPADLLNGKYDDRGRPGGSRDIRTGYVHYGPDDGDKFKGMKGDVTHLL